MLENTDLQISEEAEGGTVTLISAPTLTVPADLSTLDDYEVRIYDTDPYRTFVAAIEIVSPANKDRPETRDQFTNYAVTLRGRKPKKKCPLLDAWFHPLTLGQPLPTIPLWLSSTLFIQL